MTIEEVTETITCKDGRIFESVRFRITATNGCFLLKDGYSYGRCIITSDPNNWKEYFEKE